MSEPSHSPPRAVVWEDVWKVYPGGHQAVRGVSLGVARGEILGSWARAARARPRSSRWSTRLIEPSSGTVVVRDRTTTDWDAIALRRSIGYVIQDVGLMPHLSVLDNVALVLQEFRAGPSARATARWRPRGWSWSDWTRRGSGGSFPVSSAAASGSGWELRVPWRPSPDLILMDEPFGALDPITRRELQDEFRRLQRRLRTTVVLVTHDLREACRLGDRLALMDEAG